VPSILESGKQGKKSLGKIDSGVKPLAIKKSSSKICVTLRTSFRDGHSKIESCF
jgi:hypothetical protein